MAVQQSTGNEIWKPIRGYEGEYEVSNLGRIRGLDRTLSDGRTWRGRILKQIINHNGHCRVVLQSGSASKYRWVHHLVLESFVGPRPSNFDGCHNDGDPSNNRVENLRWDSRSENAKDRVRHGNHYQVDKTHCPRGHDLVEPNLKPADAARGWRNCLACSRAKNAVYARPELEARFQEISDQRYERIMAFKIQ